MVAGGGSGASAAAIEEVGATTRCGGGAESCSIECSQLLSAPRIGKRAIPVSVVSSTSFILLLLVAGASTGAAAAAAVVCVGTLLEFGVGSGCVGCFFFLQRLKRIRRPLLTWAKASSAMSERQSLACGL